MRGNYLRILLFIVFILFLMIITALSAIGVLDSIFILPSRNRDLLNIDVEYSKDIPNIEVMVNALQSNDWYVVAVASNRLRVLNQNKGLSENEIEYVSNLIWQRIESKGHWWRFGWDLNESDYSFFISEAMESFASFGEPALLIVGEALVKEDPFVRLQACYSIPSLLKYNSLESVTSAGIIEVVHKVSNEDSEEEVRIACTHANNLFETYEIQ